MLIAAPIHLRLVTALLSATSVWPTAAETSALQSHIRSPTVEARAIIHVKARPSSAHVRSFRHLAPLQVKKRNRSHVEKLQQKIARTETTAIKSPFRAAVEQLAGDQLAKTSAQATIDLGITLDKLDECVNETFQYPIGGRKPRAEPLSPVHPCIRQVGAIPAEGFSAAAAAAEAVRAADSAFDDEWQEAVERAAAARAHLATVEGIRTAAQAAMDRPAASLPNIPTGAISLRQGTARSRLRRGRAKTAP